MNLFPGLEEIIKCVIRNVDHTDDLRRRKLSEREIEAAYEERYKKVMSALMGDMPKVKAPHFLELEDMLWVTKQIQLGKNKKTVFREILKIKMPNIFDEKGNVQDRDSFNLRMDNLKKDYSQKAELYARVIYEQMIMESSVVPMTYEEMPAHIKIVIEDQEAERNQVIKALRRCGWPL